MISVIVCSRQPSTWDLHSRNIAKTIGCDYEYVRIDNTANIYGICGAYNEGVRRATGDILVFVHEDCFFMEPGWGNVLYAKFGADPALGLVGVAGTQYLTANRPAWISAGQPLIKGRVIHELSDKQIFALTVFSWDKADAQVVAVDGLFFAIPRFLFNRIKFDEEVFTGFHLYDLDICMQIGATHRLLVTWDILVKHFSGGNLTPQWRDAGIKFLQKYKAVLPFSCVNAQPAPVYNGPMNFDLRGKAELGVIV
jgi:GT2 family glycosyltransferase